MSISVDRSSENEFQRQGGGWPYWRGTGELGEHKAGFRWGGVASSGLVVGKGWLV